MTLIESEYHLTTESFSPPQPGNLTASPASPRSELTTDLPTFDELGIPAAVVTVLAGRNITVPTRVQIEAIPMAHRGGDIVVQAKTGTGKTLAFGLPLVAVLAAPTGTRPRALVVTPTRELCLQVASDIALVGEALRLRSVAVYGGQDFGPQIDALTKGVDIVIGTPGRLLDLVTRKELDLAGIDRLILDEADEMLDMGFLPDVQRLLKYTVNRSSTMLFSATMPAPIWSLARGFLDQPTFTTVYDPNSDATTVSGVTQFVYQAHPLDKPQMLAKLLQAEGRGPTIVFCRTKMTAQRLSDDMVERGFRAVSLHGDLPQPAREKALAAFRDGRAEILIATDVAARGIDIDGITHVVNYQTPEDPATYLHRIGRTARAGRKGIAVTFVEWDNLLRWKLISSELGLGMDIPVETYSSSESYHSDLGIPVGVSDRLVVEARTPQRIVNGKSGQTTSSQRSGRPSVNDRSRRSSHENTVEPVRGSSPAPTPKTDRPVRAEGERRRRRTRGGV